ncbi:MAG: TlpA family protein disulfide reductase [Flavobacteriia bacterium]|nr:TlpA family protein disulfide reductase [Flavobacteriia bacterium]
MKSLLSLFLFTVLIATPDIQAQEIRISLDQTIVASPNSNGYAKLYRMNSDSIKYGDAGAIVKYPSEFSAVDTGYFFMFFTGSAEGVFSRSIAVLVANYKSDTPTFWIDQNNNLDFSDDGSPTQTSPDQDIILTFFNHSVNEGTYSVKLFRKEMDSERITLLEEHFGKPGIQKNGSFLEESKYWFADQRLNIKLYRGNVDGHEVSIGLFDDNCDGIFDRSEEDRIVIAQNTQDIPSTRPIGGAVLLVDTTIVFLNSEAYLVTEIDRAGKYLVIEKSTLEITPPLRLGDRIRNFEFPIGEDTINIAEARGDKDYLLIDVWGTWCAGCIQQTQFLKALQTAQSDDLNVLGLNNGDSQEQIQQYTTKYTIEWPNTYLTREFEDEMNIEGYPTYILIDREGRIVEYTNYVFNIAEHFSED